MTRPHAYGRDAIVPWTEAELTDMQARGRIRYHESKNPVFVWLTVALLLRATGQRRPMPGWVNVYLRRVSRRIERMVYGKVPQRDLPLALYRALGFVPRRGVNPFRVITDDLHDVFIAYEVWSEMSDGKKLDFAILDVARAHPDQCWRDPMCASISRSSVRRIWQRYERRVRRAGPRFVHLMPDV